MEMFTRKMVGTVAAGAMAVATATPALARDHGGGIDTGDVIAGALVIGGIAAVAAAASSGNDRYDYRYDRDRRGRYDYGRYGYGRGLSARDAVQQCVRTAERAANRYSYGGRAKVTDVRNVDRKSYGYKVKGRIAVNGMGRHWRSGDHDYGRGWNRDYRGWNSSLRGYDSGSFECKVDYRGGIRDLDFKGIRGL
ncbi:hypothetical protein SAMN06295987_101123 [Novosphingobium mathurense]|uniref:Uncharacterized protein n=2 Tax=Novosphingobium mathurense TaxID=428990 RepID=A0A1U6GRR0_9SPHN|nr:MULTISPECIES: hypothetical protein [Novosphingobium]CDO35230.1 conserved exported hypothetical protein [Novosphingobium sp. KN65.2]SLJ86188.1 hypothetical protein SAMN06295987_101123 [Novosphingobium mathurense]